VQKLACVVPSAGWGSVCPVRSTPKVLANVGGELMINRVVGTIFKARITDRIIVVVGDNSYGAQIRQALDGFSYPVEFVVQPERRGAADAVAQALPHLKDEKHVLVTFGDMPLWRPETLRSLAKIHLSDKSAVISLVTLALQTSHRTARYGRIVRDAEGQILAALEPSELQGGEITDAALVNPSLYVFERQWLADHLPRIPPTDKGDGFPEELHLPKLLPIANAEGVKVLELRLTDPAEALGVNTPEELAEVCALLTITGDGGEA
jgi:bifunctional UDP-N-acetylglucosamine pyrophosphorylase / glucosamine-1-phosphate N-acetyltransferase